MTRDPGRRAGTLAVAGLDPAEDELEYNVYIVTAMSVIEDCSLGGASLLSRSGWIGRGDF